MKSDNCRIKQKSNYCQRYFQIHNILSPFFAKTLKVHINHANNIQLNPNPKLSSHIPPFRGKTASAPSDFILEETAEHVKKKTAHAEKSV